MAGEGERAARKDGAWVNEADGSALGEKFELRADDLASGRAVAAVRRTEHLVHNLDGTTAERRAVDRDWRDVPG